MSVSVEKQQRFHYVDGIRAIASLMIVLHHAISANVARLLVSFGMPQLANFFWNLTGSGVDLFFVISGLVLLRPYMRKERAFVPLIYFKKRLIRIYPVFAVAVLMGAAAIWFINTYPTWYNEKGIHVYFSHYETLKELMMFNMDGVYYNIAWWSIGVEALFYMLVPLLIFTFPHGAKLTDTRWILIIIATLLFALALQFAFDSYFPSIYSFKRIVLNIGRFIDYPMCFVMGLLLATRDYTRKHAYGLIIAGIAIYMLHWIYLPSIHSAYGLFYGGVLILIFHSGAVQRFLSKPLFLWIGERSYSLFLVHLSVFYFINNMAARVTTHRGLEYALITRGLGIPLAVFVAMILFQVVEKRFARGLVTDKMFWPWQVSKMRKG
jgi:peptidoglycan/LPS O-acetylase OafA/YrhL